MIKANGLVNMLRNFNQYQDRLNTHWHRRIECVSPEMFVTAKQNNDEGDDTENKGERNISDHICRTRVSDPVNYDQDKKENGKEVMACICYIAYHRFGFATSSRTKVITGSTTF
jgi:hypothetical protein